jgi:Mrp family chromosome partitioning ATPase/capsular polysaccharide biosynthesis protein
MLDTKSGWSMASAHDGLDYQITSSRPKPLFGLASLRQHYLLVGLSSILFLAIGVLIAVHKPTTYTASSQLVVYIRQVLMGPDSVILPGRADIPLVENQIQTIRSRNVLARVIQNLSLDKDPEFASPLPTSSYLDTDALERDTALNRLRRKMTTRRVGTSHIITVSVTASEPKKAAQIVNNITHTYLQELSHAWDAATAKAPAIREIYQSLGPSAYLVSEAEPPTRSDRPGTPLIIVGATVLGFCIGAALAILLDMLNNTIRSAGQLEYVLRLKCLGISPRLASTVADGKKKRDYPHAPAGYPLELSTLKPASPTLQVVRRVAATFDDCSPRELRSLGVTSTVPGEGATTLAITLAQYIARYGKRVLLIDCVPEDGSVSSLAGVPHISLQSIRNGNVQAAAGGLPEEGGVSVLPVEELPTIDPYSVCPDTLESCIREASKSYDTVIVDLPSLTSGPDVRAVAQALDGCLLVVKWGATDSELISQALRSTGEAQAKFIGAVLTMADEKAMRVYGCETREQMIVATA